MFEFDEIVRQKESKVLNRLREGKHTSQDICTLKDRLIEPHNENYPIEAPHFSIQHTKVNTSNKKVYCIMSGAKYPIKAHGLTNDADNVIKLIHLHLISKPSGIIWVQFNHADIGKNKKKERHENRHLFVEDIGPW